MAKIVVSDLLGEHMSLADYYNPSDLGPEKTGSDKAIYVDSSNGNQIVLAGSGFEYDMQTGVLTDGEINKINFENSDGGSLITVTQETFDGAKLMQTLMTKGIEKALQYALNKADTYVGSHNGDVFDGYAGNDNIKGNDGNDILAGGKGNDTLYGGTGSDVFVFDKGDGHDTIRDFDADGGGLKQDYIDANFDDVTKIKQVDKHTVEIDFKGGDEITLLHATASHITSDDFHLLVQ